LFKKNKRLNADKRKQTGFQLLKNSFVNKCLLDDTNERVSRSFNLIYNQDSAIVPIDLIHIYLDEKSTKEMIDYVNNIFTQTTVEKKQSCSVIKRKS
jgi:hypothetical protein